MSKLLAGETSYQPQMTGLFDACIQRHPIQCTLQSTPEAADGVSWSQIDESHKLNTEALKQIECGCEATQGRLPRRDRSMTASQSCCCEVAQSKTPAGTRVPRRPCHPRGRLPCPSPVAQGPEPCHPGHPEWTSGLNMLGTVLCGGEQCGC